MVSIDWLGPKTKAHFHLCFAQVDEEGVEEKREERHVRKVSQKASVDFKLWIDEKYYVDE